MKNPIQLSNNECWRDFDNRIPQRSGLVKLLVDLMRLRATQIAAVAAALARACADRADDHGRILRTAPRESRTLRSRTICRTTVTGSEQSRAAQSGARQIRRIAAQTINKIRRLTEPLATGSNSVETTKEQSSAREAAANRSSDRIEDSDCCGRSCAKLRTEAD